MNEKKLAEYKRKYDISVFILLTFIFSVIFFISLFFRVEKFIIITQSTILFLLVIPILIYLGKERLFVLFLSLAFIPFEFTFGGVEGWVIKDFLTPEVIWFLVGLVLLVMEFMLPGLIIGFFGVGAWIVAIVCLMTDIGINAQLGIFIASSVLSLSVISRPKV